MFCSTDHIFLALLGISVAAAKDLAPPGCGCQEKVTVQIYFEPGCKFCRQYLADPVGQLLQNEDIKKCVKIELNPLGNAFYAIPECANAGVTDVAVSSCGGSGGYDAGKRACFNEKCGPRAKPTDRAANCFGGPLVFQHGFQEAWFTRYFACAKHSESLKDWEEYVNFVRCMEHNYTATTGGAMLADLTSTCAKASNLDVEDLENCYRTHKGEQAFHLEAEKIPPHAGVPWIIVNDAVQAENYDMDTLTKAVRLAMTNCTGTSLKSDQILAATQPNRRQVHQHRGAFLGSRPQERQITC